MTTVTVTISGRQFRLRCDDQERTLRAAAEVERLLEVLSHDTADQSTPTLALLAALNLAERQEALYEHQHHTIEYLRQQLGSMGTYLREVIDAAVETAA
jgi:cell division protein ZapA (FtsZ GTPase activity inhibitor)